MTDEHDRGLTFLKEKGTNFPERPKLVDDVSTFSMPDGLGLQFRGLPNPVVLKGALVQTVLPELLPLLDGTRAVSEVLQQLSHKASAKDLASLLMNLFMRGLISAPEDQIHGAQDLVGKRHLLFLGRRLGATRYNSTAGEALKRLSTSRVLLIAEGLLGLATYDLLSRSGFDNIQTVALAGDGETVEAFSKLCPAASLNVVAKVADAVAMSLHKHAQSTDLVVAALRNAPGALFDTINQICVQAEVEWLRAHDNGSVLEVGPFVSPHDSPCLECMTIRKISVDEHAIEEELYQKSLADNEPKTGLQGESIAMATLAASYIVQEAVRIVSGIEQPALDGVVISFASDGNIEQHSFTRVPRCEVCSRGVVVAVAGKVHAGKIK